MDKNDFKNTCFLANVSDEELKQLVEKCGYKLYENIDNETNNQRKVIERIYDNQTKKVKIEISCVNSTYDKIKRKMYLRTGLLSFLSSSIFDVTLILVNDYLIGDLCNDDNETLQKEFANFMYNKFGEIYRIKYNKYHYNRNKKIEQNERNI